MIRPRPNTYKRTKTRKAAKPVKDVAKAVQKLKNWQKLHKPETTELIRNGVVSGVNNITTTASVHSLTALSSSFRRGKELTLKSAMFKGFLRWTAGTSGGLVTLTFVKSNDQVRDTYDSVTNSYSGGDTNYGFPIEGLSNKFTVLKKIKLLQNTSFQEIPLEFSLPVSNIRVRYNGDLATDIEKNGIYVYMQSNMVSNMPTLNLNECLRYFDA